MHRCVYIILVGAILMTSLSAMPSAAQKPPAPIVYDEGKYSSKKTEFSAFWTPRGTSAQGQKHKYALGTAPGAADVVGWTETSVPYAFIKSPELTVGAAYYLSVCSDDADGVWSEMGFSGGIIIAHLVSTAAEAKLLLRDGEFMVFEHAKPCTAGFGHFGYVQDENGLSGIRVEATGMVDGWMTIVGGVMGTVDGERTILDPEVIVLAPAYTVRPWRMACKAIGGLNSQGFFYGDGQQPPKAWCWTKTVNQTWKRELLEVHGVSNTGLLVQVCGKVSVAGDGWFYVDDGSGYDDTETADPPGLRVSVPSGIDIPPVGSNIIVSGISSVYLAEGNLLRLLRVRIPDDIKLVH